MEKIKTSFRFFWPFYNRFNPTQEEKRENVAFIENKFEDFSDFSHPSFNFPQISVKRNPDNFTKTSAMNPLNAVLTTSAVDKKRLHEQVKLSTNPLL